MSNAFSPTPAEDWLTTMIFDIWAARESGVITGETAVGVFNRTNLSPDTLGKVWAIADEENRGSLKPRGVSIALRLMGHAQRGEPVAEELISKPGLPPSMEGLTLPFLAPKDISKFKGLFEGSNPVNGILSGDKVDKVFKKSQLHSDVLAKIKELAAPNDTSMNAKEFCIAMYLIQATMTGQLHFVPKSLPPGLYDQASGAVAVHTTGSSLQLSPSASRFPGSPVQPQHSGGLQSQLTGRGPAPNVPPRPAAVPGPNTFNQSTPFGAPPAPRWDITPAEKANSDRFFGGLERGKGYVEADAAVPFMMQSNLPEEVLAQIWELSDLNKDGRLTKDGFAIAFHLIQSKLAGEALPATLPLSLVPPSLLGGAKPASAPQQPVPEIQDLLWDDSPPPSTTATAQPIQPLLQPQRTGTLNATPIQPHFTGSYQPPIQPQRTGPQLTHPPPVFPQSTGGPTQFTPALDSFAGSASRDLLSDDEPSVPAPLLEDKSADIGNLHNQLNSTNRSLRTVQNERADVEQRLAEQAAELSNLQTQLTAAKTAYETETKLLVTLRERYANQNADINKARQELITAESDVSALRLEKNEVQNALLRDKEEVRELQKKMAAAGAEIETIKAETEKSKKDAKQQKGLLAIAKKQLAAREAEKIRAESERGEAGAELVEATKEKDETEAELAREPAIAAPAEVPVTGHGIIKPSSPDILAAAIAQPLPDTPGGSTFGSPSLRSSSVRSTNPFERLTTASPPPRSPFMPFGSSTEPPVPTRSKDDSNTGVNLDDPFGLGTSRVEEPQPIVGEAEPSLIQDRAMSPSTGTQVDDLFVTPPTSASPMHESPQGPERAFTTLDAAASKFPLIPGAFSEEPDSVAPAEEVAAEGDSSDDEDGPEEATAAPERRPFDAPSPAPAEVSKESPTGSSFDDVFGVGSETSVSIISMPSTVTPNQTGSEPPKSLSQPPLPTGTDPWLAPASAEKSVDQSNGVVAGKNAFDEAMGVIPSGQATTNVAFGFEPVFDDDFDFVAAKADSNAPPFPTPFPAPVPSQSHPTLNGVSNPFPPAPTSTGTPFHVNVGFNNAFGVGNFTPAPDSRPPTIQTHGLPREQARPPPFDTAFGTAHSAKSETTEIETKDSGLRPNMDGVPPFGGDRTSKNMALFTAFGSSSIPQLSTNPSSPVQFPQPSTPHQGISTPPPGSNGSTHSHPEQPSNKLTPPKPRPGTADKVKEKEHHTRTSRLSIRLPFGRKKKSQDAPPIPARGPHLTPPQEYNSHEGEDVDSVKQLTGMGFGREEAVAALERTSYDFQRALNSLVGSG